MNKKLWIKNPFILFSNFDKILPNENNIIYNSNNLARLAIYMLIIISFSNISNKYLSIPIIILIFSYIMVPVENFSQTKKQQKKCTKPTKDNPYMNFTLGELIKNPERKPACKLTKEIKKEINKYTVDKFKDPYDLFNKGISFRQFYTMPVTTIVNDQKGFAKELYGTMGLCKEFGKNCLKYSNPKWNNSRWHYCK